MPISNLPGIYAILARMFARRPDLAGEPPLATLSRALIDQNNVSTLEVAADGSLISPKSGNVVVDATGNLSVGTGTTSIIKRGLIFRYRLDEGSGTTAGNDAALAALPNDGALTLQFGPIWQNGGLTTDQTVGSRAVGSLGTALTGVSQLTLSWTGRVGAGQFSGYRGIVGGNGATQSSNFSLILKGGFLQFIYNGQITQTYVDQVDQTRFVDVADGSIHKFTGVYNGTDVRLYIDGCLIGVNTTSPGPISIQAIELGAWQSDGSYGVSADHFDFSLYSFAMTAAQVRSDFRATQAALAAKFPSVSLTYPDKAFATDGDSIDSGNGTAANWFATVQHSLGITRAINFAVPSATISGGAQGAAGNSLVARAPMVQDFFGMVPAKGVFVGSAGHNDAMFKTPAQSYADYKAYMLGLRPNVKKLVAASLLGSDLNGNPTNVTGAPTFAAWRSGWNSLLYSDVSTGGIYDALIDFAANPIIGTDAAAVVGSTYFPDGVHPNTAGHAIMATVALPVLAPLLT